MSQLLGLDELHALAKPAVQMPGFSANAILIDDPCRRHQMRVRIVLAVQMHVEIDTDALLGQRLSKVPCEIDLLIECELTRQRNDVVFGELSSAAASRFVFGKFDLVPERVAIKQMLRRTIGQQYVAVYHLVSTE